MLGTRSNRGTFSAASHYLAHGFNFDHFRYSPRSRMSEILAWIPSRSLNVVRSNRVISDDRMALKNGFLFSNLLFQDTLPPTCITYHSTWCHGQVIGLELQSGKNSFAQRARLALTIEM